jgi:two-component system chemotaxis response regulator CheY
MDTLRALVVDDSAAMRRNLMYALSRLGQQVECVEAQDGAEGLRKFHGEAFDLVLTDINMPLMDGLKLVSHIRRGGVRSQVPIVVITTESSEEDRERAMALGASAYLVKPIQARDVLDTVKGLLSL